MKLLLIGAVIVAALGLFLLVLFGPNSGGTLARQTTFITSPLAADGLPNYALAILEEQGRGVTQDNNGAVLFWQAVGPQGMPPEQFQLLSRKLGVEPADESFYLVDVDGQKTRDRLLSWFMEVRRQKLPASPEKPEADPMGEEYGEASSVAGDAPDHDIELLVDEIWSQTRVRPWTSAELPPLAEWVAANEEPLDLIVAAASKPRFFSPPPNLLADPNTPLIATLLPHVQAVRDAAQGLAVRAMHRAGEKRYAEAWQDCLACWRLGGHMATGATVIDRLVGMAIRATAKDATLAILDCQDLPPQLARQILSDIESLPQRVTMADAFDHAERFMFLDQTLRQLTGRLGGGADGLASELDTPTRLFAFNVDEPLRIGNSWYDRITAAAKMEDIAARRDALASIDADLQATAGSIKSGLIGALFSRQKRSEVMGNVMVALMLPSMTAAIDAENRDAQCMALMRIAASLAIHRAETGSYPASLDELTPKFLAEVPPDRYSGKPPIYERRDEGYVLYSVFENGVDDGGLDFSGHIVKGEWIPAGNAQSVNHDQSDFVFRVPRPPWQLPLTSQSPNP